MSRTFRRKKIKSDTVKDWNQYSPLVKEWFQENKYPFLKTVEAILKMEESKYHRDNQSGEWSAPNYFGKGLNKQVKHHNKLNLIRSLREETDFIEIPLKKDSGYDYW